MRPEDAKHSQLSRISVLFLSVILTVFVLKAQFPFILMSSRAGYDQLM